MWVNLMMTIWLWVTILSFVLIAASLWIWYRPESYAQSTEQKENHLHEKDS